MGSTYGQLLIAYVFFFPFILDSSDGDIGCRRHVFCDGHCGLKPPRFDQFLPVDVTQKLQLARRIRVNMTDRLFFFFHPMNHTCVSLLNAVMIPVW